MAKTVKIISYPLDFNWASRLSSHHYVSFPCTYMELNMLRSAVKAKPMANMDFILT